MRDVDAQGLGRTGRPRTADAQERLRHYAGWCNAVEGNTTFYATPSRATVESWASQTPEHFRFAAKLPRTVTHGRQLNGADLRTFLHVIEPLGPAWTRSGYSSRARSRRPTCPHSRDC